MNTAQPIIQSAIVIVMAFFVISCGPEPVSVASVPQPVKVFVVTASNVDTTRRFPAVIEASEVANIASKVPGTVTRRLVQPGDAVNVGDLLFTIDETNYQLNLKQAQANYQLAKVSFDRVDASRKQNIATAADFDNTKSNLDKAKVALEQTQNQLNDTRILAPISGTVVRVGAQQYDFINAAHTMVTLQSTANFDVKFQVPSDLVRRYNGDPSDLKAKVSFDTIPNQFFDANFKDFSADSDRSTRSFDMTLSMPMPALKNGNLFPGMDANVFINLTDLSRSAELHIPSHAVFQTGGRNWVWKVNDKTVVKTEVIIGQLHNALLSITSGLSAGDIIVEAGVQKLVDGQVIEIWAGE